MTSILGVGGKINPIGSLHWVLSGSAPVSDNYVLADGSELDSTEYPELATFFGQTYGVPSQAGKFKLPKIMYGDNKPKIKGSLQGPLTIVYSGGFDNTTRKINVDSSPMTQVGIFEGDTKGIASIAVSSDGDFLYSGVDDRSWSGDGGNGNVRKIDASTMNSVAIFNGSSINGENGPDVRVLVVSPDDRFVYFGGYDYLVQKLNASDLTDTNVIYKGHSDGVLGLACSPDGQFVFSGSVDTSVRKLKTTDLTAVEVFAKQEINAIAIAPDDTFIYIASENQAILRKLNASDLTQVALYSGEGLSIDGISVSPDGVYVYIIEYLGYFNSTHNSTLQKLNVSDFSEVAQHTVNGLNGVVTASPDGLYVFCSHKNIVDGLTVVEQLNAGDLTVVGSFTGHSTSVTKIVVSPDSSYVYTASRDNTVRRLNAGTMDQSAIFNGHSGSVLALGVSPDGLYVYSWSYDNTFRKLNAGDLTEVTEDGSPFATGFTFNVSESQLKSDLTVSPNGAYVYLASPDTTVIKFDAATMTKISVFGAVNNTDTSIGHIWNVLSVIISSDGLFFYSGGGGTASSNYGTQIPDNSVRKVDTSTMTQVAIKEYDKGHTAHIFSIATSPDGQFVYTGSGWDDEYADRYLRKLNASDLTQVAEFTGHTNNVNGIVVSPDNLYVYTSSWDYTVNKLNASDLSIVATFTGRESSGGIGLTSDGEFLYIGTYEDVLVKIDTATMSEVEAIVTHSNEYKTIAVAPRLTYPPLDFEVFPFILAR